MKDPQISIQLINMAALAYFENQLEKFGVDYTRLKPLNNEQKNISLGNVYNSKYKIVFETVAQMEFENSNEIFKKFEIEEFIRKFYSRQLKKSAIYFTRFYRKYPNAQFIFTLINDSIYYLSSENIDPETNIIFRTIYGSSFGHSKHFLTTQICFYIIE